jgi:tetratricopeptide (TPR) repeat protein
MLLIQGLLLSLVAILMGGDAYPYSRFLIPVAALLAPAAETGYRLAWGRLASWKPILVTARVLPVALVLLLVSGEIWSAFMGLNYQEFARDAEGEARRRPIGEYLRRTAPPGTLVAMNPVGIIPYLSGLPTLDQLGLTDAHIARRGHRIVNTVLFAHDRYDADYVLARRPGIIILGQATVLGVDPRMTELRREGPATFPAITSAITRELHGFPGDAALWYKPDFRRLYQPTIARIDDGFFYHFVLDRRAHELMQRSAGGHITAAEDAEMASLLQAKGETRLAVEAMRQAESKDPSYAGRRAELEQALSAPIRQAAALEDSKSVLRRMEADLQRGDAAAAEKDLVEGIQASPGNAELVYNLAVLYEQTARLPEAQDAYRRVLKLDPESYDAWNNLGTIYARQGDLKQARSCWEQAVALNPASPAADNLRRLEAMKQ